MSKCDICNGDLFPEDYGYKVQIKSLDTGARVDCFCCSGCFNVWFRKGLIAIGDGKYRREGRSL